jgi:hypothetical protein
LGRSLKRNQRLERLYLASNKLGDAGVQHILEGACDNVLTLTLMAGAHPF